jgi:hypothetical protein
MDQVVPFQGECAIKNSMEALQIKCKKTSTTQFNQFQTNDSVLPLSQIAKGNITALIL